MSVDRGISTVYRCRSLVGSSHWLVVGFLCIADMPDCRPDRARCAHGGPAPRVQGTERSIGRQFGPRPALKDILILRFDTRCYIQDASADCPEWRSRAPRPEVGRGRALPRGTIMTKPFETTGRAPEPGLCARLQRTRPVSAHWGDGPMAPTTMARTTRAKAGNETTSGLTRKHAVTCFPSPPSAG